MKKFDQWNCSCNNLDQSLGHLRPCPMAPAPPAAELKTDYERDRDGMFAPPAACPRCALGVCSAHQPAPRENTPQVDVSYLRDVIKSGEFKLVEMTKRAELAEQNWQARLDDNRKLREAYDALKRELTDYGEQFATQGKTLHALIKERDAALAECEAIKHDFKSLQLGGDNPSYGVYENTLADERDRFRAALENIKVTLGRAAAMNLDAANGYEIAREALSTSELLVNTKISNCEDASEK